MKAFVDFTYRIRYLIFALVAVGVIHFAYTFFWTGDNVFHNTTFVAGFVLGLAMWGASYVINRIMASDKQPR
jgi:hypothetical protein